MNSQPCEILLQASGLAKSYSGAPALSGVDFDVRRGQVHALVGENGAGKSTLARILCGLTAPDTGRMQYLGRPYRPAGRLDAERLGVRMVTQELNLIDNLTAAENIFLGRMPARLGLIDYRQMNQAAAKIMAQVGLGGIEPTRLASSLGVGQRQMLEIAAALSQRCDLLVLDEPTAALTDAETELLFDHIARLKKSGVGLVYISHRLEEIRRIADRITVLRDGCVAARADTAQTSIEQIIRWMVGRELPETRRPQRTTSKVLLRVRGLCRGAAVRDVSFDLHAGEILGFAGLMGSGRTETMRLIFGADPADAGEIFLCGSTIPARIRSPKHAVRCGIALLTEDRRAQGLLLPLSVRANVTLGRLGDLARPGGWISPARETSTADRLIRLLSIRCRSPAQPVVHLSGGNQQKVVIARWIDRNCNVLIFDEPTRGIDVGAKFEVHRLLADLASQGKGIIVVSSDLKELLAVSDRIAVMSAGRLAAVFDRGAWDPDKIMTAALSGYVGREPMGLTA